MRNKKLNKKLLIAGTLLAFSALFTAGCGSENSSDTQTKESSAEASEANADNNKVVRILSPGTSTDGGALMSENAEIAQLNGYFEEELEAIGYTVEYYGFQNQGVGVNEALAAAEGDIAVYGEYPAITYLAGGNDGELIGIASTRKQMAILAQEGISSVEDLKGATIGATLGTNSQQYLDGALAQAGLTEADVNVVNASSDLPSLFISGEVDAIVSDAQMGYYVRDLAGSGSIVAVNGDDEEVASNFLVIGRETYLNDNPEVAQAVINALGKAQKFAEENQDQVYEIFANTSDTFTADTYKEYYSFDTSFSFWNPELNDDVIASIQNTADYMAENGYIANKINISDFVKEYYKVQN